MVLYLSIYIIDVQGRELANRRYMGYSSTLRIRNQSDISDQTVHSRCCRYQSLVRPEMHSTILHAIPTFRCNAGSNKSRSRSHISHLELLRYGISCTAGGLARLHFSHSLLSFAGRGSELASRLNVASYLS